MIKEDITREDFCNRHGVWVAMDEDKQWWWYSKRPNKKECDFHRAGCTYDPVSDLINILYTGSWEDSLCGPAETYAEGELVLVWMSWSIFCYVRRYVCTEAEGMLTRDDAEFWPNWCKFDEKKLGVPIFDWEEDV